jgi:hypothetical protein
VIGCVLQRVSVVGRILARSHAKDLAKRFEDFDNRRFKWKTAVECATNNTVCAQTASTQATLKPTFKK